LLKDAGVWDAPRASRVRDPSLGDVWLKEARAKLCSATVPSRPKRRIEPSFCSHSRGRHQPGAENGAPLPGLDIEPARLGSAEFELAR
jgi:hypothetical protein